MNVGVRELRNDTARVIDAVRAGERVTLTVRGEPVADIVPHGGRTRWLSGIALRAQLAQDSADAGLRGDLDELVGDRGGGPVTAGLLDTSVFIARESGHPLGDLPERVAVSVITIGELELGCAVAVDADVLARRAATLSLARTSDPFPVTEPVMSAWARLVADCRSAGVQRAVRLTDALIAATAIVHGLPVVTQDEDFDRIARAHSRLRVIRV